MLTKGEPAPTPAPACAECGEPAFWPCCICGKPLCLAHIVTRMLIVRCADCAKREAGQK